MGGTGCIGQLAAAILQKGYNRVFLITGKHWDAMMNPSVFGDITVTHILKKGINVNQAEIDEVYGAYIAAAYPAIVAIGGGSVIDLAKGIIYRHVERKNQPAFFAAAPTTAGSGSEATHFAVVYRGTKKESLVHDALLPSLVILDAALTASLPAKLTAISGMDALSQAIESYWNKNATETSRQFARESIELWREHFMTTVKAPTAAAREGMLRAAHLAGKAINITRTTGPHALSYYLTANYNVPHGQAVALFLPLFIRYNEADKELCDLLGVNNFMDAALYIEFEMKQAGLATRLKELQINKAVVTGPLLDEVNEERFANNPATFDREKLTSFIDQYL